MGHPSPELLGPSSFRLGPFQVWVRGRQFPDAQDSWDGNWLNVVVHCGTHGASVWAEGPILDTVSLSGFRTGLAALYETLGGEAVLESLEPNVRVDVSPSDRAGHMRVRVAITPDHLHQAHRFEFDTDQTYLPPLLTQLDSVLKTFPIRGTDRR
jgi:hypothetical protein